MCTFSDSFKVKLRISSLKKMYSLASNICHPIHPLARDFLNFVILSRDFSKILLCDVCLSTKKNANFDHFSVLCFFYRVAPINPLQAIVVQFSTFCSSRLPFRLILNNLLKNLIICHQHFDVFMISSVYYSSLCH